MFTLSYRLFLFVLAFAPLAFGTVEHWSLTIVEILVVIAMLACLFGLRSEGESGLRPPGTIPFLMVIILMALQLVPLPPSVIKIISPASFQAYLPIIGLSGGDDWISVSVNRKETLQELLRYSSYFFFYLLTVQLLRNGERIRNTMMFVVILASFIAFVAILQQFSAEGNIYWFRAAPGGAPGGPWINSNQYSAFIEAIVPLVLALFLFYRPHYVQPSFRERVVAFFSVPGSNRHLLFGVCFIFLVFSVFVSLCRGGIITILGSMIIFMLFYGTKRKNFVKGSFWMVLCLALLAVSFFGWDSIFSEFDRGFGPGGEVRDGRLTVWHDTLLMIRDYPVLGSGFGTFRDVYPVYQTVVSNGVFEHAHNDYLELLSDGGFIGFLLAAWFCFSVSAYGVKKIKIRRDRFAVLAGIGAVTSIWAMLLHLVVDFNMHSGAVGLYFFFVCGLLVAVVSTRYERYEAKSLLNDFGTGFSRLVLCLSGFYLVCVVCVQVCALSAAYHYAKIKDIYVSSHLDSTLVAEVNNGLAQAMTLDPLEGRYPFYRGDVAALSEGREEAYRYYVKAGRKQPMAGIYLQRIGMMLPAENRDEAVSIMSEGYSRSFGKNYLLSSWVEWLFSVGKRTQAVSLIHDRLKEDARPIDQLVPILEEYQVTNRELEAILPRSPDIWIRYGAYIEKYASPEDSLYYRKRALDFIDNESEPDPYWFNQLIGYYQRRSQPEKIPDVVQQAVEVIPDHAPFHFRLGEHYQKEGITYRAVEEYEKAVILEPENESYRRRLRRLKLDIEFGK